MNPISEKIEKFLNETISSEDNEKNRKRHTSNINIHNVEVKKFNEPFKDDPYHSEETHEINYSHVIRPNHTNTIHTTTEGLKKLHKAIGDHLSKLDDKA